MGVCKLHKQWGAMAEAQLQSWGVIPFHPCTPSSLHSEIGRKKKPQQKAAEKSGLLSQEEPRFFHSADNAQPRPFLEEGREPWHLLSKLGPRSETASKGKVDHK